MGITQKEGESTMGKNRIIVTAVAIATAANSLIPMAGAASVTDYTCLLYTSDAADE
mgnify:CR=1 FL=1